MRVYDTDGLLAFVKHMLRHPRLARGRQSKYIMLRRSPMGGAPSKQPGGVAFVELLCPWARCYCNSRQALEDPASLSASSARSGGMSAWANGV